MKEKITRLMHIIGICLLSVSLSSCGYLTNNFEDYNSKIAAINAQSREAYADSLAACMGEQGCLVGVTASYYSNAGQVKMKEPETPLAYLAVLHPYLRLAADIWGPGNIGRNEGGLNVQGDHNILMDVGNKKSADNYSSLSNPSSMEHQWQQTIETLSDKYTFGSGGTSTAGDASFVPIE